MEREIIEVTDFDIGPLCSDFYWEEEVSEELYYEYFDDEGNPKKPHFSDNFIYIEEKEISVDLNKHYWKVETIIQRVSDEKYFKILWERWYHDDNTYPKVITEVFQKQIMINIYE